MALTVRVLFVLPGMHRVHRGAEIAFESLAEQLSQLPGWEVTLIGSGHPIEGRGYQFLHAGCIPRERFARWPRVPILRSPFVYEELSFLPTLLRQYQPDAYDVTITCSEPFMNWALRLRRTRGKRPTHIFVTQNGDWAPRKTGAEYRWFSCDGLVCTNQEYLERHRDQWNCALIPNGVDVQRFTPGKGERSSFGVPSDARVVLMVSALADSKRVLEGIESVAPLDETFLLIAGDGPLAVEVDERGRSLMGDRYRRVVLTPDRMPDLYRAADVLLHMSQTEPFGNIYLEALASGLPVVADNNPNTRWILEDQGFPVDTARPDAVREGILAALASSGEAAQEARRALAIRRYAWPIVARAYAEFCEQTLTAQTRR